MEEIEDMEECFAEDEKLLGEYRSFYHKAMGLTYESRSCGPSYLLGEIDNFPTSPLDHGRKIYAAVNHPHRLTELIREKEWKYSFVDEALIATYSLEKLKSEFRRFVEKNLNSRLIALKNKDVGRASHDDNALIVDTPYVDDGNDAMISFSFPFYKSDRKDFKKFRDALVDRLYVCGYNFSFAGRMPDDRLKQPFDDADIDLYSVQFEAKFFDIEPELAETLYHVVPSRYIDSVKKRGLIPRTKSFKFKYPERVYLFNNVSIDEIKAYGVAKIESLRKLNQGKYVNDNGFFVLKVKRDKLETYKPYVDKKLIFYYDPCYARGIGIRNSKGIFTYGNIPRSLIEDDCLYFEVPEDGIVQGDGKASSLK